MVISKKISPFDASGLRFGGEEVEMVDEMKLVGFVFDKKMTLEPMVKRSSKKGRAKVAALYRLKPYLDSQNIETMYKAFVRSSIEYGNLEYMVAAPTHLKKLDRIQAAAERLHTSPKLVFSGQFQKIRVEFLICNTTAVQFFESRN